MRSTYRKSLLVMVAAAAIAVPPTVVGPAAAATVACGDTITQSTTLSSDLSCDGTTDGLVIGADGVSLDLAGHTISGPGAYATPWAGVRVTRQTAVTIVGGTITGFQAGVVLNEATTNTLMRLTVHDNDQGINLAGGGGHRVEKNVAYGNGRDAIRLGLSSYNVIAKNTVRDNVFGIGVADGSANNLVEKNDVSGSRDFGIALFGNATGNRVEKNVVRGTTQGHGIALNNDSYDLLLLKNEVSGNAQDGIHSESASVTVTKNLATSNGQLGINAPGATDGGGNKATGNGNPAQCIGVACG